jgi:hypothetical protein
MRRSAILGLAAAAVLATVSVAAAEGLRWQLGVKNETPTWIRTEGVAGKTDLSWYMTYEVENKTGAARTPTVRAVIVTETGKKHIDSGDPVVIEAVKTKLDNKDLKTASDLRKGIDDGAKVTCVATFGNVDKYAQQLDMRIYGLEDPVTMVKGKQVYEVRYWNVKYQRKGDEFRRTEDNWNVVSSGWVVEAPKADKAGN